MHISSGLDEVVSFVGGLPAAMDALRRAELKRLAAIHDTERAAQEVEQQRLAAKYGAESTQAQTAAQRLAELDALRAVFANELQRETMAMPKTSDSDFVVFGRVLGAAGEAIQAATVTAVDSNGNGVAGATTGPDGLYELRLQVGRQSADRGAVAPSTQLEVSRAQNRAPFRLDEVFEPMAGRLAYRDIVVPEAIVPPTPSTRSQPAPPPRARKAGGKDG